MMAVSGPVRFIARLAVALALALDPGAGRAFGQFGQPSKPVVPGAGKVRVERRPIRASVALKAVVESDSNAELALRPEAFTAPLVVNKAVDHGSEVKKGDVVVEFDHVGQAIKDLQVELNLSELALKQADRELPVLERLLPMDLAAAERAKARAAEDLARFLESDKPLAILGVEYSNKASDYYLESAKDELAQLEKMYRAKDLTEETEQLILKRQRFQVESAQFQVKQSRQGAEQQLKVDIPRRELAARELADRQAVALEKARELMPLEIGQKRLARDKLAYELGKNAEKLARLERDRKAMTVRAPVDGLVYYGKATRGQWPAASTVAAKLGTGGTVAPGEVFATIVTPRPASLRATVEEKDLEAIHPGLEGQAAATGYPSMKFPAKVVSISPVPVAPGSFEAKVDISLSGSAPAVVPGMAATVRFVVYRKDDALTLPEFSVFTDGDDDPRFVYQLDPAGKPVRKVVVIGKATGGRVEVVEGLEDGEEVLANKP